MPSPLPPRITPQITPLATAFGGLLALAGAMGIGRFVYTPILPFMTEGVPLSPAEGGLIASANFLGYLIGALLASLPGLPGQQRTWLVGALGVSVVTSLAMSVAGNLASFAGLRFVSGLASAFAFVFAAALVLDRLARLGRPGLSALHFAGVGLGIALSALLVAGLAAAGSDWRGLWLASGGVTFILAVAVTRLLRSTPSAENRPQTAVAGPARLSASVIRLIIAYGLYGLGYVVTATFVSVIARSDPALASAEALVWLTVGLTAAPSILIWNWVAGRIGAAYAFALAAALEAVGVVLSVISSSPLGILAAAALLGGTFVGITALGFIEARRLTEGDPRRLIAAMTASFGLGQMLGPSFAGFGADLTGSFLLPSLAAATCLILSGALMLWPTRPDRID
ncbi:YbfB/YjiJ family MFS transporter [Pannonibacter sp.]|uniref:YbfB/YjiJ family MFS transporter n=1 Tax=Pannonibacter sp. TaxID=1906786 RepID=UPI003F70264A